MTPEKMLDEKNLTDSATGLAVSKKKRLKRLNFA